MCLYVYCTWGRSDSKPEPPQVQKSQNNAWFHQLLHPSCPFPYLFVVLARYSYGTCMVLVQFFVVLVGTRSLTFAAEPIGWPYEYRQIKAGAQLQPRLSLAFASEPIGWQYEYHQIEAGARSCGAASLAGACSRPS